MISMISSLNVQIHENVQFTHKHDLIDWHYFLDFSFFNQSLQYVQHYLSHPLTNIR